MFELPMRTDLHDTDSCLSVSIQDGVKNRCRTSPPRQQAGVNVEYPAVQGQIALTICISNISKVLDRITFAFFKAYSMPITDIVQLVVTLTLKSLFM